MTIDFSDFAYNDPVHALRREGGRKAIVALETEYLEAAHDAALDLRRWPGAVRR